MTDRNTKITLENKVIILQVLFSFEVPLTNHQTTEFILENELINYFDLQHYLNELVDTNMIDQKLDDNDNEMYYYLTEKGKSSLDFFNDHLPTHLRRLINDQAGHKKERILANTKITADYKKIDDNEFLVELKVQEYHNTIINLQLNIISSKHAKLICEKWENEAQFIYGDILNLLVDDRNK